MSNEPALTDAAPPGDPLRRRRRTKHLRRTESGWRGFLRSRACGRVIAGAMAGLALGYAGWVTYRLDQTAGAFGPMPLGASLAEARQRLGAAGVVAARGDVIYETGGARWLLAFDPLTGLHAITCTSGAVAPQSCPAVLGLAIGSSEGALRLRLGAPDALRVIGGERVLDYAAIGFSLHLRQGQVAQIDHHAGAGGPAWWRQLGWLLIP